MYQTLQSTGLCWHLQLVVPNSGTMQLYYGSKLKDALNKLQPNIPVHIKPDHILSKYFRQENGNLTLVKGNLTERGLWQGRRRRNRR